MKNVRAPLAGSLAFFLTFGVGVAFVRLDERNRRDVARRTVAEMGLAQTSEIEKQLDRAFAAAFATAASLDPRAPRAGFLATAPEVLRNYPTVGQLELAPNGVVTDIFPIGAIDGEHLGRDLLADGRESGEPRAAHQSRRFKLAGPYPRGRSGPVVFGYLPFWSPYALGRQQFEGFVVVAVRVSDLLSASHLQALIERGYDYQLARATARGQPAVFARSTELDLADPVPLPVKLTDETWTLSIGPRQGWYASAVSRRDLVLAAVMALVVGLFVYDMLRRPEILRREVERHTRRLAEANRQMVKEAVQRERAEQKLLHEASHDALTDLPNRAYLLSQISRALESTKRGESPEFAVVVLALDRFTAVNDSFGPSAGDRLLTAVARRLEAAVQPDHRPARIGGDEFAVLLTDAGGEESARAGAIRLQTALAAPFSLDGTELFVTASTGVVVSSIETSQAEDLLRDANLALRRAKSGGGSRVSVFVREMHAQAVRLVAVEHDLRLALERNELLAFYEPVVSMQSGCVSGFEALARWHHPQQGLVLPGIFIPVAESTGLVVQVDRWVWREAARQICDLQRKIRHQPPLSVSVNISVRHLTEPDLVRQVAGVLDDTGLNPACFRLEITESMMMEHPGTAAEILRQLKTLGIRLLLDDFGTGYSSLSYLHELPIDVLKIDRSFINLLATESKHLEIVRSIITLGKNLGLDVIAEGVETSDQLARLHELGCGFAQGWLFSRPVTASDLQPLATSDRLLEQRSTPMTSVKTSQPPSGPHAGTIDRAARAARTTAAGTVAVQPVSSKRAG